MPLIIEDQENPENDYKERITFYRRSNKMNKAAFQEFIQGSVNTSYSSENNYQRRLSP